MDEYEHGDMCGTSEATADCTTCQEKNKDWLQDQLDMTRERVAELEDQLLRAQADYENYRKRVARDHADNIQLACESLIRDLLPILDNFSLGLRAAEKSGNQEVVQGFNLILGQLQQLLSTRGLSSVGTIGDVFDSNIADALTLVSSANIPEGHVVDVVRAGYFLGKKLLRPAAVTVSSGQLSDETNADKNDIAE
ncbi:MAG: nucleotide exchange factor GrpE [Puniceicoccales bacterium]|jgi:molecular chaperone GrpE|nr:nucleotide exchange factor GrpE [Puniceicoccales bacterium]